MGELRTRALGILAFTVSTISACGPTSEPPRWAGNPESLVPELCGDVPKGSAAKSAQTLPTEAVKLRDEGMNALRDGDFVAANEAFEEAIELAPSNVALVALHGVANDGLRISATDIGKKWDKQRPIKLEALEEEKFAGPAGDPVTVRELGAVRVSDKKDLGAVGRLFSRNQVPQLLRRVYSLGNFAVHEGGGVVTYTRNQRHLVLQVGLDRDPSTVRVADYGKFVDKDEPKTIRVSSTVFDGDDIFTMLTVGSDMAIHAHNRHDGKAKWRVPATNTYAINVVGEHVVAVTNKEFLVFDRHTGRNLAKHAMGSWSNQIVVRDGYIFAMSGRTARVFELGTSRGKNVRPDESIAAFIGRVSGKEDVSLPNVFATKPDAAVDIAAEHRCGVTHALAELDAGQFDAATKRLTRMSNVYPNHAVVLALTATSRFMQRKASDDTIDLSGVSVRSLHNIVAPTTPLEAQGKATLKEVSARPAESLQRWATRSGISRFSLDPDAFPPNIPRHFGRFALSEWSDDGDAGHVVIYGRRFIVLVKDGQVDAVFDGITLFDEEQYSGMFNPGTSLGFINLAMRRGDKLFVSFIDRMSQTALASIDISSGRTNWRTPATMRIGHFAVARDHVVAAMGNKVFFLRQSDGALMGESVVADPPRAVAVADKRVLFFGFSGSREYTITEKGG